MTKMYGIFLVGDDERWFNTSFSNPSRAKWYAGMQGLEVGEYEVRFSHNLGEKPQVAKDAA